MAGGDQTPTVGVVGDAPDALVSAARGVGRAATGGAATVVEADPDLVVAVGEPALLSLVRAGVEAPVLPVGAGAGVGSVPRDGAVAALERAVSGVADERVLQVYAASVGGDRVARALVDLALLVQEPARISEFSVSTSAGEVARFRADGVVVGTPAGSAGYARAAGGPRIEPGTGVVAVVPVARFSTARDRWVLDGSDVRLAVEREGAPVALYADDREVRRVEAGTTVRIAPDGTLATVVTAESRSVFE